MDVGEATGRHRHQLRAEADMPRSLSTLAVQTFTGPTVHFTRETPPDVSGGNQTPGGAHARVGDAVDRLEHPAAEVYWHQGAQHARGGVTEKLEILDRNLDHPEGGGGAQALGLLTDQLLHSHLHQRERVPAGPGTCNRR